MLYHKAKAMILYLELEKFINYSYHKLSLFLQNYHSYSYSSSSSSFSPMGHKIHHWAKVVDARELWLNHVQHILWYWRRVEAEIRVDFIGSWKSRIQIIEPDRFMDFKGLKRNNKIAEQNMKKIPNRYIVSQYYESVYFPRHWFPTIL